MFKRFSRLRKTAKSLKQINEIATYTEQETYQLLIFPIRANDTSGFLIYHNNLYLNRVVKEFSIILFKPKWKFC